MEILEKINLFQRAINELRPLEGNSLTESETKALLEDGLTVGGKPLREVLEAVNHAKAYDFMFSIFRDRCIDEQAVLKMHELFYQNIESEYAERYRDIRVIITGSGFPVTVPEKISEEMKRLFEWIQKEWENYHPVEFAAQLHKRFVFIHPFKDR